VEWSLKQLNISETPMHTQSVGLRTFIAGALAVAFSYLLGPAFRLVVVDPLGTADWHHSLRPDAQF
jgi:hypothetical protein